MKFFICNPLPKNFIILHSEEFLIFKILYPSPAARHYFACRIYNDFSAVVLPFLKSFSIKIKHNPIQPSFFWHFNLKDCKFSHKTAKFIKKTLQNFSLCTVFSWDAYDRKKRRMKSSFEYRIDFLFFVFLAFLVYNPRFLKSCDKNTKKNCIYQNEYVCSGILKFF